MTAEPGPPPGGHPGWGPPPWGGPQQWGPPPWDASPWDASPWDASPWDPPARPRNGLGVASLVLGIVGLLTGWVLVGLLPAVVGAALGLAARARVARGTATNRGVATAGLVVSVLAVPVGIGLYLAVRHYVSHHCYDFDDGDRRTHVRCD